jgi:tRNA (cmo5U34)-methyltransferase
VTADWDTYRALAKVAVPRRIDQLALILSALPRTKSDHFTTVELGCGEGHLAWAILAAFPRCTVVALDGDATMRHEASVRLSEYGDRVEVRHFDLFEPDWMDALPKVDCFVSFLALHHLDDAGKRELYSRARAKLTDEGAFVLADIALPASESSRRVWADAWDRSAREAAVLHGDEGLYRLFLDSEWNLFRFPDPDFDRPATLADQLSWLRGAGFTGVECFWLEAGHAIVGGYASERGARRAGLAWDEAAIAASRALRQRP